MSDTSAELDRPMVLHLRGDLTMELPGRVMGPDRWGMWVVIVAATYDIQADRTTAEWKPITAEAMADRVYDGFSQAYLLAYAMPEIRRQFVVQLRREVGA